MSYYKTKQNRFNVKEILKKATDRDFYNLFQPIIPKIDLTGKLAQCISAATEAVSIWKICQSELSSVNKGLAILLSIIAVIVFVAAIEIGGRKLLQVVVRAIVWKRLKNFWYYLLFTLAAALTGFLFWQSYSLSTNGIGKTFTGTVRATIVFDDSDLITKHDGYVEKIDTKFDRQKAANQKAYALNYNAKEKEYAGKIKAQEAEVEYHKERAKRGVKWAKGHYRKHTKILDGIEEKKEAALTKIVTVHSTELKDLEDRRMKALGKESSRHLGAVTKAEKAVDDNDATVKGNANFWGGLFSNIVGIMIITLFFCIVAVEAYYRGAGIEIDYVEREIPPSFIEIIYEGICNRIYNASYEWLAWIYEERKGFDFAFLNAGEDDHTTPSGGGKHKKAGKQSEVNTPSYTIDETITNEFSKNEVGKQANAPTTPSDAGKHKDASKQSEVNKPIYTVDKNITQEFEKNEVGKQAKMIDLNSSSTSKVAPKEVKNDGGGAEKAEVNSKQALEKPVANRDVAHKQSGVNKSDKQSEVNTTGKQSSAGESEKVNSFGKQKNAGKQSEVNTTGKQLPLKKKVFTKNEMEVVQVNTELFVEIGGKQFSKEKVLNNLKTNKSNLTKIIAGTLTGRTEAGARKAIKKWSAALMTILDYENRNPKKEVTLAITNDAKVA